MTHKYTRSQIRANRQKWIDFLMVKGRKKATGRLDNGGGARCCLGHGCYVLGIKPERSPKTGWIYYDESPEVAPESFMEMVGLWSDDGAVNDTYANIDVFGDGKFHQIKDTLAEVNDETGASPKKIGEYLLSVIEGGDNTPFRPLSEYGE